MECCDGHPPHLTDAWVDQAEAVFDIWFWFSKLDAHAVEFKLTWMVVARHVTRKNDS